jgi:hypothetical protein
MLHVDTNKSLTTYPALDDTFASLWSRVISSLSASLSTWVGSSGRIVVPPMSTQWLREQDARDKKAGAPASTRG